MEVNLNEKPVDEATFVNEMETHWTKNLGNISSEPLKQVWWQLAQTFNSHIQFDGITPFSQTWTILQPATGTGKTQGTMIYCKMLSKLTDSEHPGVLIVTRLKAECDRLVEQINKNSDRPTATAFHSDTKDIGITELWLYPVLVITHRAYTIANDFLHKNQRDTRLDRWSLFQNYFERDRERKLIVVDECLDIVEENRLTFDGLNAAQGLITQELKRQYPEETEAVNIMAEKFKMLAIKAGDNPQSEKIRKKPIVTLKEPPDFTEFRRAFLDQCQDREFIPEGSEHLKDLDGRFKSVHHLLREYNYSARVDGKDTLSTSRLLIPDNVKGACVLDATASSNLIYQLFKSAFVITPPEGARRYNNVSLHVSRNHKTGKRFMEKHAKKLCGEFLSQLEVELKAGTKKRKTLIVSHKNVESPLRAFNPNKFEMHTTHWGKHTGSNEWKDCDTCAIFGLPWRPSTWSPSVYCACKEPTEEILNGGSKVDTRKALEIGQIVVDVVQAVNRTRSRKVIDSEGNCSPVDVYLLLPKGDKAKEILEGIQREMPGIKLVDWIYKGQRHKIRKSNYEQALITYFENMENGACHAVGHVRNIIGMSPRCMANLIKKAQTSLTTLGKAMSELGVRYAVKRKGKINKAIFIKN